MILNKLKKKFKNKTVIVTGHTGFKGSWLSLWLSLIGAKVIGVSNKVVTNPSHFRAINLSQDIEEKFFDISNSKKTLKLFKNKKPDFVFHLAAQAIVRRSLSNTEETWRSNLMGTLSILESLKKLNNKCTAVLITSDKVYKNLEIDKGYKENDTLGGSDPYSASKGATEFLIKSYLESFFFNKKNIFISVARAGNVIGGGDWSEGRLIPDCIKSWVKNKKVMIRNPRSTRPWQHVLEVLFGYLILADKLSENSKLHGQIFNFGPPSKNNFSVIDVLKILKLKWSNAKWKIKKSKFKEQKLLRLNSKKASKVLKWKCKLNFKQTLNLVLDWYINFYFKKKNVKEFSIKQIKIYCGKLN